MVVCDQCFFFRWKYRTNQSKTTCTQMLQWCRWNIKRHKYRTTNNHIIKISQWYLLGSTLLMKDDCQCVGRDNGVRSAFPWTTVGESPNTYWTKFKSCQYTFEFTLISKGHYIIFCRRVMTHIHSWKPWDFRVKTKRIECHEIWWLYIGSWWSQFIEICYTNNVHGSIFIWMIKMSQVR
jgi:hypothetical protein